MRGLSRFRQIGGLVLLVLVAAAMPGCESKVTQSNFDQITIGMTRAEVENLLGSGTLEEGAGGTSISAEGVGGRAKVATDKVYVWAANGATIVVIFEDGKVASKHATGMLP